MTIEIETERLVLRDWRDEDREPWAEINADPEVRRYLGGVWDEGRSIASIALYQESFRANGFGFWALADRETNRLIGFAGLDVIDEDMPFSGVEIGWRLARSAWGHGYASEAATALLHHGFTALGMTEIYAITDRENLRSQAVMRRIGMVHAVELDFTHHEDGEDHQHTVYVTHR